MPARLYLSTEEAHALHTHLCGATGLLAGIRERVATQLSRPRTRRPIGRPPLPDSVKAAVLACLANGTGVRETARIVRVSAATVSHLKNGKPG